MTNIKTYLKLRAISPRYLQQQKVLKSPLVKKKMFISNLRLKKLRLETVLQLHCDARDQNDDDLNLVESIIEALRDEISWHGDRLDTKQLLLRTYRQIKQLKENDRNTSWLDLDRTRIKIRTLRSEKTRLLRILRNQSTPAILMARQICPNRFNQHLLVVIYELIVLERELKSLTGKQKNLRRIFIQNTFSVLEEVQGEEKMLEEEQY